MNAESIPVANVTNDLPPRDHNQPITFSETFYSIQGEGYFTNPP